MTHPKQLENVARAIYYTNPIYETSDKVVPYEDTNSYIKARVTNQAQAAIEAASRPLPIEDAPKGQPVLVIGKPQEEVLDKQPRPTQALVCKDYSGEWCVTYSGDMTFIMRDIEGWLPIPTQEGGE